MLDISIGRRGDAVSSGVPTVALLSEIAYSFELFTHTPSEGHMDGTKAQQPKRKPHSIIWGRTYTPPSAALFCLNFLGRSWFDAKLPPAEKLPPGEALTFVRLLITLYAVQKNGLLMSKKDVMRYIDAEHISTAKRYTDLAVRLGFVETRMAKLDSRIQLLYLTEAGRKAVEHELEIITKSARWLVADLSDDPEEASRSLTLKNSITVEAPKLEELAIVKDQLIKAPPGSVPGSRARASHADALHVYRPLTAQRWVAAYSETLHFDPKHRDALDDRWQTNAKMLENYDAALEDLNTLIKIEPTYLVPRAELHLALGNLDQAIADIDQVCRLDPDAHPQGRMTRAEAYAAKGEWLKAYDDIEAVFSKPALRFRDPWWPEDWHRLRGIVLAATGHAKQAIPNLEKARDRYKECVAMYEEELTSTEPMFAIPPDEVRELRDHYQEYADQMEAAIKRLRGELRKSANPKRPSQTHIHKPKKRKA